MVDMIKSTNATLYKIISPFEDLPINLAFVFERVKTKVMFQIELLLSIDHFKTWNSEYEIENQFIVVKEYI